jgi:uncharacterized membrane protein
VDAWRKFVVFKRIREDAVPILTDEERLENVLKAENVWGLYPLTHSLIWCVMELTEFGTMFSYRIFSAYHLITMAVWIVLFLMALLRAIHFLLWKRQCKQRMERSLSLFLGKTQMDKWYLQLYMLILVLFCVSMLLIGQAIYGLISLATLAAIILLSYIIEKLRPDSATAGLIQILGSIAIFVSLLFAAAFAVEAQREKDAVILEPPLTFADMGIDMPEPEIRYSREQESIFGCKQYANLDYGKDYLFYDIYTTDIDWVLDKLWKEETKGRANDTRDYCTSAWGAEEAFRNGGGSYLVRYEDAIWVINPSLEEPLTQEQIDLAIAAIKGD